MKTIEFLRKHGQMLEENTERHTHPRGKYMASCASVSCDGLALYSYGVHCPLFWYVVAPNGKRYSVRNIAGYSNTTGKHIAYAPHADIDVKLSRYDGFLTQERLSAPAILEALTREHAQLVEEMAMKKRKDTQLFASLEYRRLKVSLAMGKLTSKKTKGNA